MILNLLFPFVFRLSALVLLCHILQRIFTALQNQQIKRNIILCRRFIEFLKQGFRKTNRARNIRIFQFIVNFKHGHHPNIIMLIFGCIYITVYSCIIGAHQV